MRSAPGLLVAGRRWSGRRRERSRASMADKVVDLRIFRDDARADQSFTASTSAVSSWPSASSRSTPTRAAAAARRSSRGARRSRASGCTRRSATAIESAWGARGTRRVRRRDGGRAGQRRSDDDLARQRNVALSPGRGRRRLLTACCAGRSITLVARRTTCSVDRTATEAGEPRQAAGRTPLVGQARLMTEGARGNGMPHAPRGDTGGPNSPGWAPGPSSP